MVLKTLIGDFAGTCSEDDHKYAATPLGKGTWSVNPWSEERRGILRQLSQGPDPRINPGDTRMGSIARRRNTRSSGQILPRRECAVCPTSATSRSVRVYLADA